MNARRRLAAIMFTDIQGYTRLMQSSETAAITVRRRHRAVFEPITKKYGGEIIQYYGDGTLSIFGSSVNAVRCGCEMQQLFREEPEIPVRIGIHTGDIVLSHEEIIGDSVNLAARVESLGVAGSVLISGKVAEEIANQDDLPVRHLGQFHFKNDHRPRDVFAMNLEGLVVPNRKELSGKLEKKKVPLWRSPLTLLLLIVLMGVAVFSIWGGSAGPMVHADQQLAVLPFFNQTNDPGQDFLVNGVHEAIISELQLAGVEVKPRTTMIGYRDTDLPMKELVKELGTNVLVEGSILRQDNEVFITVRLVDGKSDAYLWQGEYEAEFSDLLTLYREVTRSIAGEIKVVLTPDAEQRLAEEEHIDPRAYELYLKAQYEASIGAPANQKKAIRLYKQAAELVPDFGPIYTGLAEMYLLQGFGQMSAYEAHTEFRINAEKALNLDPSVATDHHLMAMIRIFTEWNWEEAEKEILKAIEADPTNPDVYDTYCQFLWAMGRPEESVKAGEQAVALGPDHHFANCDLSWAYYAAGDLEQARHQLQVTIDSFGTTCPFHSRLHYRFLFGEPIARGSILRAIDKMEEELDTIEFVMDVLPILAMAYAKVGNEEKALEIIGREEFSDNYGFRFLARASVYAVLGDYEQAVSLLEEAFLQRSFTLIYVIKMYPEFRPLQQFPPYQALLAKMGLSDSPS